MPKHHDIKVWPVYEAALRDGTKTFEYRLNDRDYKAGDTFTMRFWDPLTNSYLSEAEHPPISGTIGYVLSVSLTHVVWSILP